MAASSFDEIAMSGSKNKFLNLILRNKSNIALFCILVMFAGLLVSRVALTLGVMGLGFFCLLGINPKQWFKNKWWLAGVCFVAAYAISFFWSTDTGYWWYHVNVKMPVLLLPLAFAFLPAFSTKQYAVFTVLVGLILLAGACYSCSFLIHNLSFILEEYRTAHMLPTPVENDYVRFSLCIALFVMWCVYVWPRLDSRGLKWFTGICATLLVLFLHILAAKTGLVSLYAFLVLWGIYLMFKKKIAGLALIGGIVLMFSVAHRFIPTLKERVGYMGFTYLMYQSGDNSGHYGDIGRLISYDIAIKLIRQNPLKGLGAGDMYVEMIEGYHRWYPAIAKDNMLLPHNQFLTVALGVGIPGLLVFLVWVLSPLGMLRRNRNSFFLFSVWLVLLLQLMIEPVLEVQFGVFVYLFFLLWQMHTFKSKPSDTH